MPDGIRKVVGQFWNPQKSDSCSYIDKFEIPREHMEWMQKEGWLPGTVRLLSVTLDRTLFSLILRWHVIARSIVS